MKMSKIKLCGLVFGLISASNVVAAVTDQSATYKNQRGSVMVLNWHEDKNSTGVPVPLQGYFNGNAVAITVNFSHCNVVASISGNLMNDNSEIQTIWLLASQVNGTANQDWNSNTVGTDHFKKLS
jgi:hypothetical protein